MPRTILIAAPDASVRERIVQIAHDTGYRVLKAQTVVEMLAALDACPISGVVIDEQLLRGCDLRRLLVRAQVLVISKDRREPMSEEVTVVSKDVAAAELMATLVSVMGDPRYHGPRFAVPMSAISVDIDDKSKSAA